MWLGRTLGALALALVAIVPFRAEAASLQPLGDFDQPVYVTSDPSNPERLFVAEREGRIVQLRAGSASTFADITVAVGCGGGCSGERGLLSIALSPDFASSGRLYVDYADDGNGTIHIAELRAFGGTVPSGSLRDVLTIPHGEESNHNGGQLQFGPDGFLYISTGDGGGSNDVHRNAQSLTSLLGKILRIDPRPGGVLPYAVPSGNPFPSAPAPANTIWAYGLRNPFRFSFDRAGGAMVIGDVGQGKREEVDYAPPGSPPGANYGWSCREGLLEGPAKDPACAGKNAADFVNPVFDYPHADPGGGAAFGCAIIGGYVARDTALSGLTGRYLYGDLCSGRIRSLDLADPFASDRSEGLEVANLNSFGEDSCGRLYTVSGSGQVARLVGPQSSVCPLAASVTRIKATSRRVKRGRRALITASVSPCADRRGEAIALYRGRRRVAVRHLDLVCSARFRPRIGRRSTFRAKIASDGSFEGSTSRRLTIAPRRAHRRPR
jgi:glucose/arabinose dehydrogenase